VAVVVQGGRAWPAAAAFAEAVLDTPKDGSVPTITAVWWTNEQGETTWCGGQTRESVPLADDAGDGAVSTDSAEFAPSAAEALAFAQVNRSVAEALRAHVMSTVLQFTPRRVLDAYAGTGPLAEALALEGVHVLAIEADRAGANAAVARLAAHADAVRQRVRVVCDLVERALPPHGARDLPDVVVVNPPRRGVEARVTTWLDNAPATVRGIVYISCNPATLARDLSRLPSWRIDRVECFDMFPQTAHVETVCVLRRTTDSEAV
jgi:tRNA/tmRNA/rRNA uracil-C5-methylase (TrmA/RlmC/RlmD family)